MGKLKDWSKVFEDLEYFLYGAKMVFDEGEKTFAREKRDEIKKSISDSFEQKAVRDDYAEKFVGNEKVMELDVLNRVMGFDTFENVTATNVFEESSEAKGFENIKLTDMYNEAFEKVRKASAEKFATDTAKRGEIGKVSFKKREQITESQIKKEQHEGERIKLEFNNVNNLNNDVDFDTVTEVITQRLMDAIQKGAEGLYI